MAKRRKYVSKWQNDTVIISAIVGKIEQQNVQINERLKNVFYLTSQKNPEVNKMCIYWGRTTFNEGDELNLKGRFNEQDTFLAWSLLIVKRKEISV